MSELESDQNINPTGNVELSPEEIARQKIVEHLKDAELESPRFQAFADYADLEGSNDVLPDTGYNKDMVKETIRRRINGLKGYFREYEQIGL